MRKQLLLAIAALAGLVASQAHAASPVARLTSPRTSCVAPCAVFFDARGTTDADLPNHAAEMIDLTYTWNFGDPGSGTWNEGARAATSIPHSRNTDTGFVAGHLYETPGTYSASVTVSDGNSSDSDSIVVSIQNPSAVWPGTSTVCIAASSTPVPGSGGCPSGAATYRSSDFDLAISANGCDDSSVRCLFRRGDIFTASASALMTSPGPTMIGAYGSGAKPRVNAQSGIGVFRFDPGNNDIRIVDLQLVGANTDDGSALVIGFHRAGISRLLALRLDISRFDQQIHFRGTNGDYEPGVNVPREVALIDNTVVDGPGLGGVDVYVMWEDSLLLGNRIGDKFDGANGLGEHVIRAKFSHGVVYSHNSLGLLNNSGGRIGCGSIRQVFKHPAGLAIEHFPAGVSREFILADNYISSCSINQWDVAIGRTDSGIQKLNEGHQMYVVERNFFTKRFAERGSSLSLVVEGEDVAVRNNVFDISEPGVDGSTTGMRVTMFAPVPPPIPTRRTRIYNNTCYRSASTIGGGVCIDVTNEVDDATVLNNLVYDSASETTLLNDRGRGTTTCSGCNVTTSSSPLVSTSPLGLMDFALARGSALVDAGQTASAAPINFQSFVGPLDGDANGVARFDIGAWEVDGAAGGGGSPPAPPILLP